MVEIISFGNYGRKFNFFESIWFQIKQVGEEIKSLNLFTKITIILLILFVIFAFRISGEISQYINYADSNQVQVGSILPSNCHLAVDLSSCPEKQPCQPKPNVVCDKEGN